MRPILSWLLLMIATSLNAAPRETVVILHGVALNRLFCVPLERSLRRAGYDVINHSMPTRRLAIDELANEWLPNLLRDPRASGASKLHFVTHSMGGLVVRRALQVQVPSNLGRVVMLVPPNQGSELADHLSRSRFWRWLVGVNLCRLGTGSEAFWRELPERVEYPVGIIAATRVINPLGLAHLPKPHDGAVSVRSTHLEGELDHLELPFSHTGILFRREAARQAISFLRSGSFARRRPPEVR